MKYRFEKNNYRNFKIFRDNILEPRSYFIPYGSLDTLRASDIRYERYHSDMTECLSGEWDFKYYPHCARVPEVLNTDRVKFDAVRVPSTWQRTGYGRPVYLNCPYEFDNGVFKGPAPDLPEDMPAGVYRKLFRIAAPEGGKYILTFLGAANNIEVYVNGEYVGYSEGSHNTAEFDITGLLSEGENELVVLSFKWCCGSYLEAQDMFRENGIFRDVLLTRYDASGYVYDVAVRTEKKDGLYSLECSVNTPVYTGEAKVRVALYDGDDLVCESERHPSVDTVFTFDKLDVREWSAEIPELYTLFVSLYDGAREVQAVRQFVGFKTVEIIGNVFYFNGKKIKFKGVNHHDSHPVRGYAMTHTDYERDVALMKQYNVNAVRTSHYPPDPYFLMLCDLYGLYVVDEADIETHGAHDLLGDVSAISQDIKWQYHYVDRISRMYLRDRNHASVTMWSLGNEAGGYKCQDAGYKYLKSVGTPLPVHYEGVANTDRVAYDVVSEMYTHIDKVREIGEGSYRQRSKKKTAPYREKPFFLCEYAHAMGFGPGSLEEYWELFYEHDNLMGGCIWEWVDHAVFHYKDDYRFKYTYGGDHREKKHDGNFCCDGLFFPDRTPHTGAREMKNVYRPVRAEYDGDEDCFVFTNTNYFRSTADLKIKYTLLVNGIPQMQGGFSADIPPCESRSVRLAALSDDELADMDIDPDIDDVTVKFDYYDGDLLLAYEQVVLFETEGYFDSPLDTEGEVGVSVDGDLYTVHFEDGCAVFDVTKAGMISYVKNGTEYVDRGENGGKAWFAPVLSRAALDNDRNIREFWEKEAGLYSLKVRNADCVVRIPSGIEPLDLLDEFSDGPGNNVAILFSYDLVYRDKPLYSVVVQFIFDSYGSFTVSGVFKSEKKKELNLPRYGFELRLPSRFGNVMYFGDGPYENLPDINAQCFTALFTSKVADMHEDYIFPQENSVHCNTRYMSLCDEDGFGLGISMLTSPFAFAVHDYTQESLHAARHPEEIERVDASVLTLSAGERGSGSASCGFDPLPEYRVDKDGCYFDFCFEPLIPEDGPETQEAFKVIK